MAFDLEKLAEMANPRSERAKDKARFRKENREWLRMSQDIALAVHYYLRNNGMSQKELAEKMGVSPAYIGKLLKGRENLTLETICKLQSSIGSTLISIAQPYVSKTVIEFRPQYVEFSEKTVNSQRYYDMQKSFNSCDFSDSDAA